MLNTALDCGGLLICHNGGWTVASGLYKISETAGISERMEYGLELSGVVALPSIFS